jgi:hypothetical protein
VAPRKNIDKKLGSLPRGEAAFIEPMECLATANLPDGSHWVSEIKPTVSS